MCAVTNSSTPAMQTALGVSTHMGWACVAAVLVQTHAPTAVRTFRLATGDPAEPDSIEPYHAAAGYRGATRLLAPADPDRVVRTGLRKQRSHTARHLKLLLRELPDWPPIERAALFVGRGRQAPGLERVLASHAQIHVAEGNAVRDAVRHAFSRHGIELMEIDRRMLFQRVTESLGRDEATVMAELAALRPANGSVWRQEQKHCALAAWVAAAGG